MKTIQKIMRFTPEIYKISNHSFPKHLYKNYLNNFTPCSDYCLCLIYLNMNNIKDKNQYSHCYRTKTKK